MRSLLLALAFLSAEPALAHEDGSPHEHQPNELDEIVKAETDDPQAEPPVIPQAAPEQGPPSGYLGGGSPYIGDPTLWDKFTKAAPDWLVALVPMLLGLMLLCRALSEALLLFAARTESKVDDKIAQIASTVASLLGRILGYVGVGMPRRLMLEKAEKIALKEMEGEQSKATGVDRSAAGHPPGPGAA